MLIGHLGPAYAARARWADVPVGWLLGATMAPDIARLALSATPRGTSLDLNQYTHFLPWSLLLAGVLALLAWLPRRDRLRALVVGGLVLSHVALDMISGHKPLWWGGPVGLDLQEYQQVELVIESGLVIAGWIVLRRARRRSVFARRGVLAGLLVLESLYLRQTYLARPYATRCLEYPVRPCWIRRHDQPPDPVQDR